MAGALLASRVGVTTTARVCLEESLVERGFCIFAGWGQALSAALSSACLDSIGRVAGGWPTAEARREVAAMSPTGDGALIDCASFTTWWCKFSAITRSAEGQRRTKGQNCENWTWAAAGASRMPRQSAWSDAKTTTPYLLRSCSPGDRTGQRRQIEEDLRIQRTTED